MKTFYIRAASSVVFLVIMVGGILASLWTGGPAIGGFLYWFLMFFILEGSIKEYFKIIWPSQQIRIYWLRLLYRLPFSVSLFAIFLSFNTGRHSLLTLTDIYILGFITTAICAFLVFIPELFGNDENSFTRIGYKLVPFIWIVVPMQFIVLIYSTKGCWFVLSIFSIIWFYDSACYIVGSLIGKHKLAEKISPKKTWEGLIGGVAFTLAGGFFINKLPIPQLQIYAWWEWMILAFVIIIAATFGDLVESLFKRGFGIKDSGTIMPGHGGYLDRFDAFFFAVPFASMAIFLMDKLWK